MCHTEQPSYRTTRSALVTPLHLPSIYTVRVGFRTPSHSVIVTAKDEDDARLRALTFLTLKENKKIAKTTDKGKRKDVKAKIKWYETHSVNWKITPFTCPVEFAMIGTDDGY